MPRYQYEAMYANGEKASGVVDAISEQAAVAQLRQSCEVVLSLKEVRTPVGDPLMKLRKASPKSLALVCQQFSIILKAGLPLVQSVDLVAGQCPDKLLKNIFRQVSEDIAGGWSLSYSLSQRGGNKLPITFIETIRAGEESGDLVAAFERMSKYYDRMSKTRNKAISAMIYPAFVLTVAVIVIFIIMVFAVPTFTRTFESMGIELPLVTRIIIAVANFLSGYALFIITGLVAVIALIWLYSRMEKGGIALAQFRLNIPVLGRIAQMTGASQFSHTMATMMAAGMPILQALDISGRAIGNRCISKAILDIVPGVEAGRSMGDCMEGDPNLPDMLVQMTAVGEATGSLEETLNIMAEYYDNEVDTATARALSLLEPAIIVGLAFVVLVILLSVYAPLFSLEQSI